MTTFIRARAAWVNAAELWRNVGLIIQDGMIADIIPQSEMPSEAPPLPEYGLLLPGFINAHCHLEYSGFGGKLPRGDVAFGDWLKAIVQLKSRTDPLEYAAGIRDGLKQLIRGGCTTVIDSVSSPRAVLEQAFQNPAPIRMLHLYELTGLGDEAADAAVHGLDQRRAWADEYRRRDELFLGHGINPHAPYSVGPRLREFIRQHRGQHPNELCAWHLHETADEVTLFQSGSGSIEQFLEGLGAPLPFKAIPGCSPAEFLQQEKVLEPHDLAFHMNFPSDLPMNVVHCPQAHGFFERPPFPLKELLHSGVGVCLGTDSLAGADTLSMLDVLKSAAREFPTIAPGRLIEFATTNPARRIAGLPPGLGCLAPGFPADIVAVKTVHDGPAELRDTFAPESRIDTVWVNGQNVPIH